MQAADTPRLKGAKGLFNLKGMVFGQLTVLKLLSYRHKNRRMWLCQCTCMCAQTGKLTEIAVRHDYLLHTNNPKTHCGCLNRGLPTLHPREYHIWNSMIRRCTVPTQVAYEQYGGRGIRVCDRWMESFENFLTDMGKRPSPKHSLDRVDPDGNYEKIHSVTGKEQCRWATSKEQGRNKRNSLYLPHPQSGLRVPAAEVAEFLGVSYQVMRARYIRDGKWPGQSDNAPLPATAVTPSTTPTTGVANDTTSKAVGT